MKKISDTKYDQEKHHRRSIRLKEYDYSNPGGYFITICTRNWEYLLGKIVNGEIQLNKTGKMVQSIWNELSQNYPGVSTDAFVVMPNHIHGIIVLATVGAGPRACPGGGQPRGVAPTKPLSRSCSNGGQSQVVAPTISLPDVVHRFKSLTTNRYRKSFHKKELQSTDKLWQRNYYEHVIRDEKGLNRIREYIIYNPLIWQCDKENPEHIQDRNYDVKWGDFEKLIFGKQREQTGMSVLPSSIGRSGIPA